MSPRFALACAILSFCALAGCGGGGVQDVDASSDVGPHDAAPPCRADVDCDDGLVCDGTERCASGRCVAGAVMVCDDGLACTIDSCSEAMRRCVARVPDADGDGAGAASCVDATGAPLGTDCDDADANRYPGNREVCDPAMHDEDCDPSTHGGVDSDGDGHEDARCCNGTSCGDDCDDAHASAHPGATEVCNLVDDDCDTHVDEMVAVMGFVDADRDGYGDPSMPRTACTSAAGFAAAGTDCDDTSAARSPGQLEFCDGVDNDCDTTIDEDAGAVPWYVDHDGDGYGSAASGTTSACVPPVGYVLRGSDCDDARAAISPGAPELCNAIDDDCNGVADYVIAPGDLEDDDRDGIPDAHCGPPLGTDCDDLDPSSGPGSLEICDGRDNDCDGRTDEGASETAFYRDADGDGYGDSRSVSVGCTQPTGFVRRGGDCDDAHANIAPGATELCDGIDEDCDGASDEAPAAASCAAVAGSIMGCNAGACFVAGCATGYAHCIASGTGCETSVASDPDHCGSCAACAAPLSSCSAGACGPSFSELAAIEADVGDVVVERVLAVPGSTDFVVAGRFSGSLTLGGTTYTSLGSYDGFAARLRLDHSVVWAGQWGGAGFDAIHAIATTPDGSAFVVGGEMCDASLCGGPLTGCYGFWQRFVSIAMGGCNYADGIASTTASIHALAMEQVGGETYVYAAGTWTGTGTHVGPSSGGLDGFVFRAREVTGTQPTYEWVRTVTGSLDDVPTDLALDGAANLVIVGYTASSADFGHGATTNAGSDDAFVMNLTRATGVVGNATQFGTSGGDRAERVAALPSGRVAIAGELASGTFTLGGMPVTGAGPSNVFVISLDAAPITATWADGIAGAGFVTGLATRGSDVLVAGDVTLPLAFDRGTLSVAAEVGAFLAELSGGSGATLFARSAGGSGSANSGGVATLSDGRVLWEIDRDGTLTVDGTTLPAVGDADMAQVLVTP